MNFRGKDIVLFVKNITFGLVSICIHFCLPVHAVDRTDTIRQEFVQRGASRISISARPGEDFSFAELYITQAAQAIIQTRNFDRADPNFSQAEYFRFLILNAKTAWDYLKNHSRHSIFQQPLVIILDDFGNSRRGTIAETFIFSRAIRTDVRRWHKFYLGIFPHVGQMSMAHEMSHMLNYQTDPSEVQYFREFSSILLENAFLLETRGQSWYLEHYGPDVIVKQSTAAAILSTEFPGQHALRHIVFRMFQDLLAGRYHFSRPPMSDQGGTVAERLRTLAFDSLNESRSGEWGFHLALERSSLRSSPGTTFDLNYLRRQAAPRAQDATLLP